MPEDQRTEAVARAELAAVADAVGRLRHRIEAVQDCFPKTPEDHPLLPNTIWAVCAEVGEVYLGLAEHRLKLMADSTEEELRDRKGVYQTAISVLLAAVSHLPEEYLAVALLRIGDMPPAEIWQAILSLRTEAAERYVEGLIEQGRKRRSPEQ